MTRRLYLGTLVCAERVVQPAGDPFLGFQAVFFRYGRAWLQWPHKQGGMQEEYR